MDWKSCVSELRVLEQLIGNDPSYLESRFDPSITEHWTPDCQPEQFTIHDVTGWVGYYLTYPGDAVLNRPLVHTFFQFDGVVAGHWASYTLGIFTLILVIGVLGVIFDS